MQEITISLTTEEWNSIIETLLFSSTADICANWEDEEFDKFVDLAIKINESTSYIFKPTNLELYEINSEFPLIAKKIKDNFEVVIK